MQSQAITNPTIVPDCSAADLALPDLTHVDWGVLDYFGWLHSAGHSGFVVFADSDGLKGMRLPQQKYHPPKDPYVLLVPSCYRSRGTALFSTTVHGSDDGVCWQPYLPKLDCSLRIRNLVSDPPTYLPETLHIEHKSERLRNAVKALWSERTCAPKLDSF